MWDWIVNILFQILKLIQGFAVDWGLSIVILVLIIRLVLTPILLRSTRSMARMQVLQPKMQEIQEKYAYDPQKQQEELQRFYSENKFNPLGGCLPLLIQMPILFALFTLFRNLPSYFPGVASSDFAFFNILPDLTMVPSMAMGKGIATAAPYLISLVLFALLTLIPTLYQSRNQTGAQAQSMKVMALVMAIMMLWMGWNLPAGVLLYYDVSSLWQVVQQIFVTQRVIEQAKREEEERFSNAPIEVDVVRHERKARPRKKN
ncbi:YidC/Oxa1 family membrane protein insertase [Collinsella sp. zg1085]|uniref:YidC/Oxa1 family membrane protein insertase n=1 Tax=Collinsella sp. zg1085 TaxID=2844380 RepID=UPI001C0D5B23|nr:YidC/Oxa1 family membrane protein insertase [Collinsella sp. zg1085]QWT17599.1 YidC/Oxa1 family membrane protein insertase [Collinsella sp. zg1085]